MRRRMRVLAVDWSGARVGAERHIWLAEAGEPGRLRRLEAGRSRPALLAELLAVGPDAIIGLDFAFSFPAWFIQHLGLGSAPELWRCVERAGEAWLQACSPPFWGRPGCPRPAAAGTPYRRAEQALRARSSIGPKSIFQVGGAGAVGTGSIRGIPLLRALHARGARVWPFDPPGGRPLVLEIYPRLLTGPVNKSSSAARAALLEQRYPRLDPQHRQAASASDDAFDAAISALVLVEHADALVSLPAESDPELRLEGRIWHPAWQTDEVYDRRGACSSSSSPAPHP